jgi:hypothetical protein
MAKVGRSSSFILLASVCAVLAIVASPALAKTRHRPVGGCNATAGSAIHQYCEAIPSSTGGSVPKVGSPSVATTLPPRVIRAINAIPAAQQALLTLPGVGHKRHHHPRPVRLASVTVPTTGIWSLPLLLILILVAVALALATGAFVQWRRRRT